MMSQQQRYIVKKQRNKRYDVKFNADIFTRTLSLAKNTDTINNLIYVHGNELTLKITPLYKTSRNIQMTNRHRNENRARMGKYDDTTCYYTVQSIDEFSGCVNNQIAHFKGLLDSIKGINLILFDSILKKAILAILIRNAIKHDLQTFVDINQGHVLPTITISDFLKIPISQRLKNVSLMSHFSFNDISQLHEVLDEILDFYNSVGLTVPYNIVNAARFNDDDHYRIYNSGNMVLDSKTSIYKLIRHPKKYAHNLDQDQNVYYAVAANSKSPFMSNNDEINQLISDNDHKIIVTNVGGTISKTRNKGPTRPISVTLPKLSGKRTVLTSDEKIATYISLASGDPIHQIYLLD